MDNQSEVNYPEKQTQCCEYISLLKLNYPYHVSMSLYNPLEFLPLINNSSDLSLIKKKSGLKETKENKGKKNKKKQKSKEDSTSQSSLSKQDVKMGIYAIKASKEDKNKKQKQKNNTQKAMKQVLDLLENIEHNKVNQSLQSISKGFNQQEKLLKQNVNIFESINNTKPIPEKLPQKTKKGKKNKGQILKKEQGFEDEDQLLSNANQDQNKQVDDFIKSIKNKKENQEKNKKSETIKTKYINQYKYLFALDPAQRLKLRDLNTISLPNEIIDFLFNLMKTVSQDYNSIDKEQMRDVVMIIDNIIEIGCLIKDTSIINYLLTAIIAIYEQLIMDSPILSENGFHFLINTLYSFVRIKVELGTNYSFNHEQFFKIKAKLNEICLNSINSITNDNKQLKNNDTLINTLFPILIIDILFFDNNDNCELNIILSQFLQKIAIMTIDRNHNDNFDYCKTRYDNFNICVKLFILFDLKKEMIYSLFIKSSKYIEGGFTSIQVRLNSCYKKEYSLMIQDIIVCYLNNFDVFYELDNLFYDEIFSVLKNYCENYQGLINYKEIFSNMIFTDFTFESDDSLIKFILFIMKILKLFDGLFISEANDKKDDLDLYISFFNKILVFVLETNQSYLREKYTILLHREIEIHLDISYVALSAFDYLKESMKNIIYYQDNHEFIKRIKQIKDFTKFYKRYDSIKKHVLTFLSNNETINSTEGSIYSLFFYNYFTISNDNDILMITNTIPYQSIINIDEETITFLMNYYIEEEFINLTKIENALYEKSKSSSDITLHKILMEELNIVPSIRKIYLLLQLNTKKLKELEIEEIIKKRNAQNERIVDSLVLYYMNQNWKKINFDNYYIWTGINIIEEIKEVNNQTKVYQSTYIDLNTDTFNKQLLPFMIQINKLNNLLIDNPSYYQIDDILIEDESINNNPLPSSEKDLTIKLKANNMPSEIINFDIILTSFLEIINHITFARSNDVDQEILFLYCQIQQFISNIFANEIIFANVKHNKQLLVTFLKRYISDKDKFCKIKEELISTLKTYSSITHLKEIQTILTQISLLTQCENNITEFITSRCCEQLAFLYPEEEIYSLLFTKDRKFLLNITNNLNEVYKYKILNEQKIQILLTKALDEENDYLEDVIYEIFGKKVIQYLEYPEEIIDYLTKMNEGLKYDLKPTKKKLYEAIFPFFYLWKNIMSKIENGFRLYTSDKQHISVIENYKTLLKVIVNYLERNSKLYEMYLLIVVSLLHLIDEEQNDNMILSVPASFDTFNDQHLTNNFDNNTYQYLLANLFKFVKIFPSLVKFYYDESKNKLKNVFKNLICNMILPKLLRDLHERIKTNEKILTDNKIILAESISSHYLQFYFNVNDEIKFQIEIKVPPIFPLKKIDISIKCNATIDERKMLNISMNLNHTLNSSIDNITDNLVIWTEDVKQLIIKGHEPCPICYFYLHTTDKSLPGIYCHTCKKKFHGLCLKEWFKNLNQKGQNASCPMCRSEWKRKL